jgi:hypothetical protein
MRWLGSLLVVVFAIGTSACTGEVVAGGGPTPGGGQCTGFCDPGPAANALAVPDTQAGRLDLLVADRPHTCAAAYDYAPMDECASARWQVDIALPPARQQPGTIPLVAGDISSQYIETLAGEPSSCGGGAGDFHQGSLQILSIDAAQVVVRLTGTGAPGAEFQADGDYTALRCP